MHRVFYLVRLSHTLSQHQNQLILGVMGIDVSLDDIKKLTPRFTVSLHPHVIKCTQTDTFVKPSQVTFLWM